MAQDTPPATVTSADPQTSQVPLSLAGWADKLSLNLDSAAQYSLIPVQGGGYRLFLSRDPGDQWIEMGR